MPAINTDLSPTVLFSSPTNLQFSRSLLCSSPFEHTPTTTSPIAKSPSNHSILDRKPNTSHPNLHDIIQHLRSPLSPLVSATSGLPHPDFPATILAYHLLTSNQLDDLAVHFHQVWPPLRVTGKYPHPIPAWLGAVGENETDLRTKRRRFGRFIGLRGCESPVGERPETVYGLAISIEESIVEIELDWERGGGVAEPGVRAGEEGSVGKLTREFERAKY